MKLPSAIVLTVLLAGMLAVRIIPVKAAGIIYIRADGSIDPPTAPIATSDNCTYVLTGNITDPIVIERDNIILDGSGFHITFLSEMNPGISVTARTNVTISNLNITGSCHHAAILLSATNESAIIGNTIRVSGVFVAIEFGGCANTVRQNTLVAIGMSSNAGMNLMGSMNTVKDNYFSTGAPGWDGLWVSGSSNNITGNTMSRADGVGFVLRGSNNTVLGNNIYGGFFLSSSFNNSIVDNKISWQRGDGITLDGSNYNNMIGNTVARYGLGDGISLSQSSDNNIVGNSFAGDTGISLSSSGDNRIFHNNVSGGYRGISLSSSFGNRIFSNNIEGTLRDVSVSDGVNVWDDGYPSGGNYWAHYTGADSYRGPYQNENGSDGIIDIPFLIAPDNTDQYPLTNPWAPPDIAVTAISAFVVIPVTPPIIVQRSIFPAAPPSFIVFVSVAVQNLGGKVEGFNVTAYLNSIVAADSSYEVLFGAESAILTFALNTTDLAMGNYTVWAEATSPFGDMDPLDNRLTDGWVFVSIPGDVNGDREVDLKDVYAVGRAFGSVCNCTDGCYWHLPSQKCCPHSLNCDIDGDGQIELKDYYTTCKNYGKSW